MPKITPNTVTEVVILFLRLKMANFSDLMDFALIVTTPYKKESRVESSFSTTPVPSQFSAL